MGFKKKKIITSWYIDAPSLLLCTLTLTRQIHPIKPTLKGGPQAHDSKKNKVSTLRSFLGLAVKERAQHSFLQSYSWLSLLKLKRGIGLILLIRGYL